MHRKSGSGSLLNASRVWFIECVKHKTLISTDSVIYYRNYYTWIVNRLMQIFWKECRFYPKRVIYYVYDKLLNILFTTKRTSFVVCWILLYYKSNVCCYKCLFRKLHCIAISFRHFFRIYYNHDSQIQKLISVTIVQVVVNLPFREFQHESLD